MMISDALFTLLIGPLRTLFELIYVLVYKLTLHPGFSIIGLSLVMNFLLLPLYNQTDAIQLEAIATEKRLKPFVSHIKKTFKGNEQFMMLQTCYRQNHYKPTDALKGISPLLLEIPFFMAAYNYLSNLGILHQAALGPIQDLGAPDGLIVIGSITINLLPILMTLINVLSSLIYTKDAPLKTKIQLYGMAALFLILLYNSPSGLVFYWTLNNLFSLIKNIFLKLKNPERVLKILSSVSGCVLLGYVLLFQPLDSAKKYLFVLGLSLALQLPLVVPFLQKKFSTKSHEISKIDKTGFFLNCGFLTVLIGILIPTAVIKASPAEFVDLAQINPLHYVFNTFLQAAGAFLIWLPIFYIILSRTGKQVLSLGAWMFACVSVVDYMFFGSDYGTLAPNLTYLEPPVFDKLLLNTTLVVLVAVAAFFIWKKKNSLIRYASATLGLAILVMSFSNIFGIQAGYQHVLESMESGNQSEESGIIPLNKNGQNVVLLMLDRAISSYIPYIMNEKPELLSQFAGFTYYPNTASFGPCTNVGLPPIFAGYEYTPEMINRRSDESLASKITEATKVMPALFNNNDFEVTVCDPTYAGYQFVPDLSIYDEYQNVSAYHSIDYCPDIFVDRDPRHRIASKGRSFFHYSLMRVLPVAAQPVIYDGGNYNAFPAGGSGSDSENTGAFTSYIGDQTQDGLTKASGINESFYKHYTVLDQLPNLTRIQDSDRNTFMMMCNDTTHEPCMLQVPEYVPAPMVDNTFYEASHADRFVLNGKTMAMDNIRQVMHYQVNMAAMLKLGQWFDFLRENDVYDNTKIIIASDHGTGLEQFEDLIFGNEYYEDAQYYNALLMVKDFGSTEFTTDNTFMTTADVPTIATSGMIDSPVNPFTNNPINSDDKANPIHILFTDWNITVNNGNTFLEGPWLSVHDNVWESSNWAVLSKGN